MKNKFWFLVKHSFMKKAGSKWFKIINIILLIAIVGLLNIDSIIKFFGGDFNESSNIIVIDNTNYNSNNIFSMNMDILNKKLELDLKYEIETTTDSYENIIETIKDTDKILIVFSNDNNTYVSAKVVSDKYIDTTLYQLIYQSLYSTKEVVALNSSNLTPLELTKLTTPINIDRVFLSGDKTSEAETMEMVMGTVFPTVIMPFFILVVFLVQMIGAEINEEKQTRSMEVIISNVSPKTHFFSKMLASNCFVLMQGLLLIGYALLGLLIKHLLGTPISSGLTKELANIWNSLTSSGFVDKLVYIIPFTIILMVLSFITYSLIAGILASMTVSMEDYQQIQTPIMVVLLIGYYLSIMAGMFEGSILIRILSYVPFISCLLSPALLVMGEIGIIDVIISIVILIVFNGILIKYGLRIYKIGILNYSTDKMWKRIFKAVKVK